MPAFSGVDYLDCDSIFSDDELLARPDSAPVRR